MFSINTKKVLRWLIIITLTLQQSRTSAQPGGNPKIFRITSTHTSFPDTGRVNGLHYDNLFYAAREHYSDSSILITVPAHLKMEEKLDVIFWFHGWRNNIDSMDARYDVIKQFIASGRRAILVLAETAKDAPDSYGGKLERKNTFQKLIDDVFNELRGNRTIDKNVRLGNVVLAGHSGAFRVIAFILQNGGVEVKQTILFDALYSQVDKFTNWIQADSSHQFINLYTNKGGGTDEVSIEMMRLLKDKNVHYINLEEKDVSAAALKSNNIVFIHSLKEHNDVVNRPDYNFQIFIENSHSLK